MFIIQSYGQNYIGEWQTDTIQTVIHSNDVITKYTYINLKGNGKFEAEDYFEATLVGYRIYYVDGAYMVNKDTIFMKGVNVRLDQSNFKHLVKDSTIWNYQLCDKIDNLHYCDMKGGGVVFKRK